jgi:hypothetical protein
MKEKDENIIIDEQDIFNFVFYSESLSADKKRIIESDNTVNEALDFYKQLKINLNREQSASLKELIAKKISAYTLANEIILYPLKTPLIQKRNQSRLAAGSIDLAPKMTTKTFVDSEKEYLIKVLSSEEVTKIFVFSTNDEVVKDFDIIIEPQKLKYHCEDNSEPLQIAQLIEAEKIQLSFNK